MEDYDRATQMRAEAPDRARQLFLLCAQRLESIVSEGVVNGRLEYNLGNAYLQAGDTGRAILHYRRARLDVPGDPNLEYNLAAARRRCLTYIPPARSHHVLRSVFFWHYGTSPRACATLAGVTYVAAFALLAAFAVYRRRALAWCAAAALLVFLATGGSVAMHQYALRHAPPGVILSSDVTVYRGPGTGYQRMFEQPLQAGVEFVLRERRGAWWRVELADGQSGWVPAEAAELVSDAGRESSVRGTE